MIVNWIISKAKIALSDVVRHLKRGKGREQQKPMKESGVFASLGNVCSFFTTKRSQKGGGGHNATP